MDHGPKAHSILHTYKNTKKITLLLHDYRVSSFLVLVYQDYFALAEVAAGRKGYIISRYIYIV